MHNRTVLPKITYSVCVPVSLGIQRETRVRRIVICGPVRLYHILPNYLINSTTLGEKKFYWT